MADTTPDDTHDSDLPDRYMVLSDGETFLPLKGSKIIEVSDALEGDDVDAAIKARCQQNDREEGAGVAVLYTAHGYEPGLAAINNALPLAGQMVRFHIDADGPGGFVGTLSEHPSGGEMQERCLFHVDGQLIAAASNIALTEPPAVEVFDEQFLDDHEISNNALVRLFQSALTVIQAPYLALTQTS